MTDIATGMKLLTDWGAAGMVCWLVWKLADKWAAAFLKAQTDQTAAMTDQAKAITELVQAVRDGQNDQHEVLLAVRVMARQVEEMRTAMVRHGGVEA
jgi:hypothetical protein